MNSNCAQRYWLIAERRDPSNDFRNDSGTHFGFSSLFASKAGNAPCCIARRERALRTRLAAFFRLRRLFEDGSSWYFFFYLRRIYEGGL